MPYPRPEDAVPDSELGSIELAAVQDRLDTRFVGSPETVVGLLETLQRVTGADELLVTTITHDHDARVASYRLLAEAWSRADAANAARAADAPGHRGGRRPRGLRRGPHERMTGGAAAHGIRVGAAPTRPSSLFLDAAAAEAERRAPAAPPITSPHDGAPADVRAAIAAAVDRSAPALGELAARVFELAEPGFAETSSVAAIGDLLAREGIAATIGVHGLPTAFVAEAPGTQPGATVALLAEYDALPGIGHACGHNLIAAASVGAFLALAELRRTLPPGTVPGRILLIGTPAEEGGNGKELLARAGRLRRRRRGGDGAPVRRRRRRPSVHRPPHRADRLPRGRRPRLGGAVARANALDAASLNYQAVGLLRQHLVPGDRIHGVFVDGGERPNVVPERARARVLRALARRRHAA